MSRIRFMNTEIDNLTMQEALRAIDQLIQEDKSAYVVTPNVDHIVQLETNKELQDAYAHASLILTDGKPLVWIAKWYGTPIKEKVSGSDLFPLLCEMAACKRYRMFFLGAAEGVAARAAENLTGRYPGLKVIGTYSPPFGFEKNSEEMDKIKTMIKDMNPDILIVGLGCPKQEKFMYYHCRELGVPVSLGLGASFDFEAGNIKRAPKWMADHGLEWLFRITQDPKRMAKRYLVDDLKIFGMAIKYKNRWLDEKFTGTKYFDVHKDYGTGRYRKHGTSNLRDNQTCSEQNSCLFLWWGKCKKTRNNGNKSS